MPSGAELERDKWIKILGLPYTLSGADVEQIIDNLLPVLTDQDGTVMYPPSVSDYVVALVTAAINDINIPDTSDLVPNTRTVNTKPLSADIVLTAADVNAIASALLGAINGVATLDGAGKIPVSQLPNSVMEYQGIWNASTNTPALVDGSGNAGDVYRVTVAGSQNLGSGVQNFSVGDWVAYSVVGVWEKSDLTDAVASVNGLTGAVNLTYSNVNAVSNTGGGREKVNFPAQTTGAVTLNLSVASIFEISPTGNITLTPSNVPIADDGVTITVLIKQSATVRTVTMPGGTVWLTAVPTQAANKICLINLLTYDGGVIWYATGLVQP